jgi:hypothetical protein
MDTDAHGFKTKPLSVFIRVHPWPKTKQFTPSQQAVLAFFSSLPISLSGRFPVAFLTVKIETDSIISNILVSPAKQMYS